MASKGIGFEVSNRPGRESRAVACLSSMASSIARNPLLYVVESSRHNSGQIGAGEPGATHEHGEDGNRADGPGPDERKARYEITDRPLCSAVFRGFGNPDI